MTELEEKNKKIEEFKIKKAKLTEQRKETSNEIKRQKQLMLEKFDKFMKQNKEIEPKTIKEMFPEDEELYKKVEELKKSQKEKEEKIKQQLEQGSNENNNNKENSKNNTTYKNMRKSAYKRQKEQENERKVEEF